jgi:hypothetical protein
MNTPPAPSLNPSASAVGTGAAAVRNKTREIGADDIPNELWDNLESLHPKHRDILRLIRHRLVDCRSAGINAGTALSLFIVSGVVQHAASFDKTALLLDTLNKHLSVLISNSQNHPRKISRVPKWWQRHEFWMITIATTLIIACIIGTGWWLNQQAITAQSRVVDRIDIYSLDLAKEIRSQGSVTREAFHTRVNSKKTRYRILPAGSTQIWTENPSDPTKGQWEFTEFIKEQ